MNNYCIYHLHSDMSNGVTNIDSVTKFQKYVDRAKEIGMKAMAFSEHGSVFAWDLKKEAIEKAGMKYEGVWRMAGKNNQGICDEVWHAALKDDV